MRKITGVLVALVLIALLYYLFIRPFEFEVKFKAYTLPGDIIQTIRLYSRSTPHTTIVEVDSLLSLKQSVVVGGRNYIYNWSFKNENDSLTKVKVQISEPERKFLNKLLVPFTTQNIEKDAVDNIKKFHEVLKSHLNITTVKVRGEAELDSSFCACSTLQTKQIEKGNGMMKDYPLLTSFVEHFNLKPNGVPIVEIKEWKHSSGTLKFDFCFPIVRTDSLPKVESITYRTLKKRRALKAEYFGNYFTSDRAWYELIQYAERKGYKVEYLPIEYFYTNPTTGINESAWKAEVFLPLKD